MTILDKIIENKKLEVAQAKKSVALEELKDRPFFHRKTISLIHNLKCDYNIITEFKRQSPSKGIINANVGIESVVKSYQKNGAVAVSILTDQLYFGGSLADVQMARPMLDLPILRKEFIVDDYQIYESKAIGADVILLIAACLSKEQIQFYTSIAHELGLEVLLELHDESELNSITKDNILVGINNRNLKTFDVSLDHSIALRKQLPSHCIPVAESGIHSANDLLTLYRSGFKTFLMGEYFMKHPNPGDQLKNLLTELHDNDGTI